MLYETELLLLNSAPFVSHAKFLHIYYILFAESYSKHRREWK
jgi:hypothetical protein